MPVTILTSDDSGAPALQANTHGTLADIMKWALPLLGWTKVWEDPGETNDVAFSSPNFGQVIRFMDFASANVSTSEACEIRLYDSFTDDTTFNFECDMAVAGGSTNYTKRIVKGDGSGTFPWKIVSNGAFVHFLMDISSLEDSIDSGTDQADYRNIPAWNHAMFGEPSVVDPTDEFLIFFGHTGNPTLHYNWDYGDSLSFTSYQTGMASIRYDGSGPAYSCSFVRRHANYSDKLGRDDNYPRYNPYTGKTSLIVPQIYANGDPSNDHGRAKIPGLYFIPGLWTGWFANRFAKGLMTMPEMMTDVGTRELHPYHRIDRINSSSTSDQSTLLIDETGPWSNG